MAVWDSADQGTLSPRRRGWLVGAVGLLDARLRRDQAVFEYTRHPDCVFRLDIWRTDRPMTLRDGTRVSAGDRAARLHFWNEQIPVIPKTGASIAWARQLHYGISTSLRELAGFLASRPDLNDVVLVCGDVPSGTKVQSAQVARIMAHYGFESRPEPEHFSIGERLQRLGENILISMILLAHNPGALHLDTLQRVRVPIYLSRRELEREFG
jgi:hypothetical protein